jgi:hypothetical protein
MSIIYDYLEPRSISIEYDFYKFYLGNKVFKNILKKRMLYIKHKYELDMSNNELIKEYFVEIFSWSVIPLELLVELNEFLIKNNINTILDPCCGNAFHACLFDIFCGTKTLSCDIQREENAWIENVEKDGRQFLEELNEKDHFEGALILSWIDGEDLARELLNKFMGNIVISLGNYVNNTRYIDDLNYYYDLKINIILKMPWGLTERIEIYKKK